MRSTELRRLSVILLGLALFLFLFGLPSAHAQLYTGSVAGVVTDSSGAVMPSAKVTLVDQDKGFAFPTKTDSAGRYSVHQVPPGTYRILVEAPGFQSQLKEGIRVDINQNVSIDFALKVGTTTQAVVVHASAVELQTEDAVTGQVINRKFINDLPLIGRALGDLAFLAPGLVATNEGGHANENAVNFNSNGSRNSTADVLLDGVSTTNFEQNSGITRVSYTPSVDAVEEFKVQQSNFSAEFGFTGSTIINVITRSGTNQFHGSAYEFLRNQILNANDWFANKRGDKLPATKRNNFGGTIGGPIRKEKTFFFFDYEGLRESTATNRTAGVPTALERTGNFGEICTTRADPQNPALGGGTFVNGLCTNPASQLWDPYSAPAGINPPVRATPVPNNDLSTYASPGNPALNGTPSQVRSPGTPGNLIDPVALRLMQYFPAPNLNITNMSDLQNRNWSASGVTPNSDNHFDLKIDHRFSERDLLSAKYSQQNQNSPGFNCFKNEGDPCTSGTLLTTAHLVAINHAHTFSPTVVLTAAYGFTRSAQNQPGIQGEFPKINAAAPDQLGLPTYINRSGIPAFPSIGIGGYNAASQSAVNIGSQQFSVQRLGTDVHSLGGTVGWVRGAHELKFGGEGRMHRINYFLAAEPGGNFNFDAFGTSVDTVSALPGGDGLASFLIGYGSNGAYEVPVRVSTQSFGVATFVQDNWKITAKLTLNLGMRYEVSTPRTERFNKMNWLDPNIVSPIDALLTPSGRQILGGRTLHGAEVFASPNDRSNYYTDYKKIQPRFGLAYKLPYGFALRGGYGIYFSTPRSGAAGSGAWGYQGFNQTTNWVPSFQNQGILPGATFSDPFPSGGPLLPVGNSLGGFNDIGFSAVGPVRSISLNTPYEQAWSLGFEKELPGKILVEANYIGKKGTHLYLGGFRELNHLGPKVLQMTPAQIQTLATTFVDNPFKGIITNLNSPLSGDQISAVQAQVPFPQYALGFNSFASDSPPIANSIYHAAQFRVEREFFNGLQFLVTYTVSKSIDDASATDDTVSFLGGGTNFNTIMVQDPFDLRAERAVSVFNIPRVLQFSYVYSLPIGRGRRFGHDIHPVLDAIVGGWQTNGILSFDDGRPLIPTLTNPPPGIPTFGQRANLTGTLHRSSDSIQHMIDTGSSYFANPDALALPDPYTFGNAPRTITSVHTPGMRNTSLSLFKEFPLGRFREGMHLEFRAESFNAFNHPQFAGPDVSVGPANPNFGTIQSTAIGARELQLALKLYW